MNEQNDGRTISDPAVRFSGQPSAPLRCLGGAAIVIGTLAVSSLAPITASAQQDDPAPLPGHRVAVLDVGYVFRNLPAIKAQVSQRQGELMKDQARRQQERDALRQAVEQLKRLDVGTPEYDRQEAHVANLDSKLRLRTGHRHHDLSVDEAKIYHDNYQRIVAAAKEIATTHNINLVVRIDSRVMGSEPGDTDVRRPKDCVVDHDSTINITDAVMRHLQQPTTTSQDATDDGNTLAGNR